jgi:hypothetical protein
VKGLQGLIGLHQRADRSASTEACGHHTRAVWRYRSIFDCNDHQNFTLTSHSLGIHNRLPSCHSPEPGGTDNMSDPTMLAPRPPPTQPGGMHSHFGPVYSRCRLTCSGLTAQPPSHVDRSSPPQPSLLVRWLIWVVSHQTVDCLSPLSSVVDARARRRAELTS